MMSYIFFFFNDTATTEIYTLSLHDALPISLKSGSFRWEANSWARSIWFRKRSRSSKKDRKSTRLNSSHGYISYAVFCLKKKKQRHILNWIEAFAWLAMTSVAVHAIHFLDTQ